MNSSSINPVVLIIDDDPEIRYSLERVLSGHSYRVLAASSGEEGITTAKDARPQVIFLDNRMGGMSGIETLQHLKHASPRSMVILMTAFGTTQTAIEAMKFGAFDYIIKPFDIRKVLELAGGAVRAYDELAAADGGYAPLINSDDYKEGIVGNSEPMQEVFKRIGQVAASDVTVMITGESGTGKELVARCIWQHSMRQNREFLAVNCAAIPDNLIESELFGHEKGSFTGATVQRIGKFELCDQGTIFLDEIGDMALQTQTKILRAIQEGEIQRVGGSRTIKVDVRLIAATNKDLEAMVSRREFREDLYYRLNVMRIEMPPLRMRRSDIPQLVDFMLQRLGGDRQPTARKVSAEAMTRLMRYPWPGNVRELENVVQRSALVARGETILPKDLPTEVREYRAPVEDGESVERPAPPVAEPPAETLNSSELQQKSVPEGGTLVDAAPSQAGHSSAPSEYGFPTSIDLEEVYDLLFLRVRDRRDAGILEEIERAMIERALRETGGNQVKASTLLGITRATLRKRIDQHRIRY